MGIERMKGSGGLCVQGSKPVGGRAGRSSSMDDSEMELIQKALQREAGAQRELLGRVTPAIRLSVSATLRRHTAGAAQSRVRHEVEDLTQEVLFALFAKDGRRLRKWDPAKGLPLARYVRLVARHLVVSFLRKRDRRVWEDDAVEDEEALAGAAGDSPERLVGRKEVHAAVLAAVEAELTQQGREIFRLIVREELSVEEVCERTGLSRSNVHVWRSRLVARATEASRRILRGVPADDD